MRGVVVTGVMIGAVPTKGNPRHTFRFTPELWAAAVAKAEERGETVTEVLRKALERYVRRP